MDRDRLIKATRWLSKVNRVIMAITLTLAVGQFWLIMPWYIGLKIGQWMAKL